MSEGRISLNEIKRNIKERRARWTAARTSVSELSKEEQEKKCGLIPANRELQAITRKGLDKETSSRFLESKPSGFKSRFKELPERIDWTDIDGVDWTTPVKDQGQCGSCVAFGTLGALETLLKIRCYKDDDKDLDFSEAHLLWCGGGSCDGWHMDDACSYLEENGVPDEACFPYRDVPMGCRDTCPEWKKWIGDSKIEGWSSTKDVEVMKEKLVNNGPQVTGMAVYEDFFSYRSGVYQHITGELAGYHCVTVVGFDDDDECWICKNSWGTSWGEDGFFKIAYGECGVDDVFGMWDIKVKMATEADEYKAEKIAVDYSFASSGCVLWAYADGKWRYKNLNDPDISGIVNVVMSSSEVFVRCSGDEIVFIKCMK